MLPGLRFHALSGNLKGRFAVSVSPNWRITFAWDGEDAIDVDLRTIMANKTLRHRKIEPAHPGELLREIVIPATGKSKTEIARLLKLSRQTLYDILGARQPVTPQIAVRLGKLFGDGAAVWLRMQNEYDIWHAERDMRRELATIPTLSAA